MWFQLGGGANVCPCDILGVVARRSYGSGSLQIRADHNGRETWYALWRIGDRRVKRRIGLKRTPSCPDGLTRVMAEQAMRRLMAETAVPLGARHTIAEAGAISADRTRRGRGRSCPSAGRGEEARGPVVEDDRQPAHVPARPLL
jgi:hypothetical protein